MNKTFKCIFCILMAFCFVPFYTFSEENVNKLIALLVSPMSVGQFGSFTEGEKVEVPQALLSVIDLQRSNDLYIYLVGVNDYNVSKPFYIIADRRLNLMDLNYPNTIFEPLNIEYLNNADYKFNGIPRETFVFKLSAITKKE